MTREQHLQFCQKCTNRKLDLEQGLICSLTNKVADFEEHCENFDRDESVVEKSQDSDLSPQEVISELSEELKDQLRTHQNLVYAIVGGLFLSLICAIAWAAITVSTGYQIGYMAVGVGFLVGFGVRFFGAGIDDIYGYIGGILALLGCLLGNLFGQVGFAAQAEGLGYFETLTFLDVDTIILIYKESFSFMDLLFYGFAIFEGYKLAFRKIPVQIEDGDDLTPVLSNLRLPLVILSFVVLVLAGYKLSQGATGEQVFHHENGRVQSRGKLVNGEEQGLWYYNYESGNNQLMINYQNGLEEGEAIWYYDSGKLMQTGWYKNGMLDSIWLNYNENGTLVDSSNYHIGRLQGGFRLYHDNGILAQEGRYERDRQSGVWKYYYEDGKLAAQGSFKQGEQIGVWNFYHDDGSIREETEYLADQKTRILNYWNPEGQKLIVDGNGTYISYSENGQRLSEGEVSNGLRVGTWTNYYSNGNVKEIGELKDGKFVVESAWSPQGDAMVTQGNGEYISYYDDSTMVHESGRIKDGLRDGRWQTFYPNSEQIQQEAHYVHGQLNGQSINYHLNGNIAVEGEFEMDQQTKDWKWYYENGQLQCTANFVDGKKHGNQAFWSESGKKCKLEVYEHGEFISESLL